MPVAPGGKPAWLSTASRHDFALGKGDADETISLTASQLMRGTSVIRLLRRLLVALARTRPAALVLAAPHAQAGGRVKIDPKRTAQGKLLPRCFFASVGCQLPSRPF